MFYTNVNLGNEHEGVEIRVLGGIFEFMNEEVR
jgi:hypothetical protein